MPFNFIENKRYSIDYINLFAFLNTHRFMRNTNIQRTFLEHWIAALWESDNLPNFDIPTKNEIYQHTVYYGDIEFYLHIDITKIMKTITTKKTISITEFTQKESKILLTTFNNTSTKEIILCEFPRSDTDFILISGQDYIQELIQEQVETIDVIYLTSEELINNDVFCSQFDKHYYIFTLELHKIFKKYGQLKFNELHLLKKSYLNQTEHKFQY